MATTTLILIDLQNDFCHPDGALSVPGAVDDLKRLLTWFETNQEDIHEIYYSLDTHRINSIFHPEWFINTSGQHPEPFTIITAQEVENRVWFPVEHVVETLDYLKKLEQMGKKHTIWPHHCIENTWGQELVPELKQVLTAWQEQDSRRVLSPVIKGTDPLREHYGIFVAETAKKDNNNFNYDLFLKVLTSDRVYLSGQALSHCVAETINQLLNAPVEILKHQWEKISLLLDTSSPIPNTDEVYKFILQQAQAKGLQLINHQ